MPDEKVKLEKPFCSKCEYFDSENGTNCFHPICFIEIENYLGRYMYRKEYFNCVDMNDKNNCQYYKHKRIPLFIRFKPWVLSFGKTKKDVNKKVKE